MQKTRKSICRWAKVALLCAAVFCVGSGIKLLDANNVSAEEGTEVAYKLDYATPTFVTTKTDNVYYDVDFTFENLAYLRNDTATDGNITISYDTISESHDYSSMNGLVRAGATIDAKYAYSGAYWEIFGNHIAGSGNKSFYEAGKTTVISYDVATHKFTTTIGGEAITLNAYAANAKTAEAIDTEGGKYIAVGVANSNDNYQSAKVTNLKVTDANGWDLGYKLSGNEPTALTSQRMATAGKTISFKMGELPEDFEEVAIYGADGRILDVELTENEGVYSFTMPSENVTIGYVSSFQPFAIEYEGFTAKLDNVYYNMEIEATKPSYVYNTNATAGNISVSYKTISESHDFGTNMNGVVRSAKFTDIAYAFNNSYWQVFGNHIAGSSNKSFYEADKVTTITYDVTTHTFSVVIDGVERVSEMSGYAGNTVKDPADIDALEGGKYIAIGSSNSGYQSMKVTDLRIADADGWDLGVSYSVGGNYQPIKDLSKWALSNKTITLKVDGEKDFDKLAIADVDGNILDVAVNEVEEGVYAFTMPEQAVKVVKINEVNAVDYYGNYFNAADNTMLIVAEENSGIKTGDDFVAYTFKFYSDDTLAAIPEEGATLKGKVGTNVITLNDKDYIKLADYTVPRTSDELQMLCVDLNGNDIKPFIHFQDSNLGYYTYLLKAWQAQYCGMDYYKNNWLQLKDGDGNVNSKEVMLSETDGRKAALIALGKVVTPEFCYRGSNSNKFTISQTYFLQGEAAMMVNGSWLEYEMAGSSSSQPNMRMMRTPVISSIIDKCTTITDDETLCLVVDSVDAVIDGAASPLTGNADATVNVGGYDISEADWQTIYDARKIIYNNGSDHAMFINKYSNAQEGAKKFVQFYFSDEGHRLFIENCNSIPLVQFGANTNIDTSEWSEFTRTQFEDMQKLTWVYDGIAQSPIFTKTSTHMYGTLAISSKLSATNSNDRKTAAQLWEDYKKDVNNKWSDWMKAAGLQ